MRKWIALLLSALMLFSLTACDGGSGGGGTSTEPPDGYDAEFTIYVNGSEEWTPFPGKSNVTFAVSDDKVISCDESGSKISFTGKQVGESTITATLDGTECKALVKVREMEIDAPVVSYNPPTQYSYKIQDTDSEGKTTINEYWLVGDVYLEKEGDGDMYHSDRASQLQYCWTTESTEWISYEKEGYQDDTEVVNAAFERAAIPLRAFFDCWEHSYRGDKWNMADYFVRYEEVAGFQCAVYKISDAALNMTGEAYFWVELETGCMLKYESIKQGLKIEVLEFNISTPQIPNNLTPGE